MPNYSKASLTLWLKDYERVDVKAVLSNIYWSCEPVVWEDKTITFSDNEAEDGEFADIEEALISLQVPFDRFADSFLDLSASVTQYRPDLPSLLITYTAADGDPFLSLTDLKIILLNADLNESAKLHRIVELVNREDFQVLLIGQNRIVTV